MKEEAKKVTFEVGEVVVYTPEDGKPQDVVIYDHILPEDPAERYLCTLKNDSIIPIEPKFLAKK